MKKYLLFLIFVVVACKKSESNKSMVNPIKKVNWITDFEAFKKAIQQNDVSKIKSFLEFPILNEGNEIWYLADDTIEFSNDIIKPFTEKDFDLYSAKIFPKSFSKSISTLNSELLNKSGEEKSAKFIEKDMNFYMISKFDKKNNTIELNLAHEYKIDNEDYEELAESNIIYYFKIDSKGKIRLHQIHLAG